MRRVFNLVLKLRLSTVDLFRGFETVQDKNGKAFVKQLIVVECGTICAFRKWLRVYGKKDHGEFANMLWI